MIKCEAGKDVNIDLSDVPTDTILYRTAQSLLELVYENENG